MEYGTESGHAVQQMPQQMAYIRRALWQPRIPSDFVGRNQSNQMRRALNLFADL
jgi:hypothetical protein